MDQKREESAVFVKADVIKCHTLFDIFSTAELEMSALLKVQLSL